MEYVVVVPFLLGMVVPPGRNMDNVHFEYTFQMDITSSITHPLFPEKYPTLLSVDFKCHDMPDGMMCRIGRYNRMLPVAIRDKRFGLKGPYIGHRTFDRDSEPFQIDFSRKGIDGYFVQDNTIPLLTRSLYRAIGDQLNVGVEVQGRDGRFITTERSSIGDCRKTKYSIERQLPTFDLNITLTSLVDFDLENHTIVITKKRTNFFECYHVCSMFFTRRFWPEIFPSYFDFVLDQSTHVLKMSSHGMESVTTNIYNMYNLRAKGYSFLEGDVMETFNLTLKSYRELQPDEVITFHQKKMMFLSVQNIDTVSQRRAEYVLIC